MGKAIKVEHLSKAYQLGDFGTGTISRDLERFWARVRGKEDPFLKIGEVNDRTTKGTSDVVWSLKDINFEINQGDSVGIIGRNGAGKSTLLKILSRVTSPTTGSVKVKGRIASLLEVGTGFHPELTGKENIYLNGAILGMRKAEIKRKFDEIVDFSGVERYIDTPVKRYSSGMYVRLAFAVAAHLESEILVVDEVLAVGDAEFQKKCLGKMGDISTGEGRTVIFVSHNMDAVNTLCKTGILMDNASNIYSGEITKVTNYYFNNITANFTKDSIDGYLLKHKNKDIELNGLVINGQTTTIISATTDLSFEISGTSKIDEQIDFELYITDTVTQKTLFFSSLYFSQGLIVDISKGDFRISFNLELPENLYSGIYNLNLFVSKPGSLYYYKITDLLKINITGKPCLSGRSYSLEDNVGYASMVISNFNYSK